MVRPTIIENPKYTDLFRRAHEARPDKLIKEELDKLYAEKRKNKEFGGITKKEALRNEINTRKLMTKSLKYFRSEQYDLLTKTNGEYVHNYRGIIKYLLLIISKEADNPKNYLTNRFFLKEILSKKQNTDQLINDKTIQDHIRKLLTTYFKVPSQKTLNQVFMDIIRYIAVNNKLEYKTDKKPIDIFINICTLYYIMVENNPLIRFDRFKQKYPEIEKKINERIKKN